MIVAVVVTPPPVLKVRVILILAGLIVMRVVAEMHNYMMDPVERVVVHVGMVVVRVVRAKVGVMRVVALVLVAVIQKQTVHVVPSKESSVRRLVVAVMRMAVAEV